MLDNTSVCVCVCIEMAFYTYRLRAWCESIFFCIAKSRNTDEISATAAETTWHLIFLDLMIYMRRYRSYFSSGQKNLLGDKKAINNLSASSQTEFQSRTGGGEAEVLLATVACRVVKLENVQHSLRVFLLLRLGDV